MDQQQKFLVYTAGLQIIHHAEEFKIFLCQFDSKEICQTKIS